MVEYYNPDGTGPYFTDDSIVPPGARVVPLSTNPDAEYLGSASIDIISNVVSVKAAILAAITANTNASHAEIHNITTHGDSETGTWSGTLHGATTDPTVPVVVTGNYIRTGNKVTVSIAFSNISTVGGAGILSISGMPFTPVNIATGPTLLNKFTYAGSYVQCYNNVGNTTIFFLSPISGGANWSNPTILAGTGRYLWLTLTYFI